MVHKEKPTGLGAKSLQKTLQQLNLVRFHVVFELSTPVSEQHTDLKAPHTGGVVEGRVEFPCPAEILKVSDIPDINTVIIVDARQPAIGGVICHSHSVRVRRLCFAGEQLTEEEEPEGEQSESNA